eukprot:357522-Chlamydomonas_euryale.AAC.4
MNEPGAWRFLACGRVGRTRRLLACGSCWQDEAARLLVLACGSWDAGVAGRVAARLPVFASGSWHAGLGTQILACWSCGWGGSSAAGLAWLVLLTGRQLGCQCSRTPRPPASTHVPHARLP